jgi:futalosine hydrolase
MPKVLIVAATKFEVEPILKNYSIDANGNGLFTAQNGDDVSVLITGVGMVNTAYQMGRYSHNAFDYVLNVGIAGAFNRNLKLGEVVYVIQDTISEMGAEDGEAFIKYSDLNLGGTNVFEDDSSINNSHLNHLTKVKAITVNKIHGNDSSIKKAIDLFNSDIESMEGAAFMRAGSHLSSNCVQLRAISNYVEKRNKNNWDIPLAIRNLNNFTLQFLQDL